jgi:hypothetical protein
MNIKVLSISVVLLASILTIAAKSRVEKLKEAQGKCLFYEKSITDSPEKKEIIKEGVTQTLMNLKGKKAQVQMVKLLSGRIQVTSEGIKYIKGKKEKGGFEKDEVQLNDNKLYYQSLIDSSFFDINDDGLLSPFVKKSGVPATSRSKAGGRYQIVLQKDNGDISTYSPIRLRTQITIKNVQKNDFPVRIITFTLSPPFRLITSQGIYSLFKDSSLKHVAVDTDLKGKVKVFYAKKINIKDVEKINKKADEISF